MKKKEELLAYCGLYCGTCAIKDGRIRNTAKSLWDFLVAYGFPRWAPALADLVPAVKGWTQFEEVLEWLTTTDCRGCKAEGGNPECAIRLCVKEKGLAGCWECDQFPCEVRKDFDARNPSALDNCCRIKEMGLRAWLTEQ